LRLRGPIVPADLRRQIGERLPLLPYLKTIEVGFAFQLSCKSGPQKERAGARAFA